MVILFNLIFVWQFFHNFILRRRAFTIFGLFIGIALCFLLVIEILKAEKKDKAVCTAHYLRNKLFVEDESFNAVEIYFGDHQNCTTSVEQDFVDFLDNIKPRLNAETGQRQYTNCVVNQLKNNYFYKEIVLLETVLDYSKFSLKFWKFFDRNSRIKQFHNEMTMIEKNEVNYCMNHPEDAGDYDINRNQNGDFNDSLDVTSEDSNDVNGEGSGHDYRRDSQEVTRSPMRKRDTYNDLFFDELNL